MWVIDGNNVMGAAGDGWWNDPVAASQRLTGEIAIWARGHTEPVTVVFDGAPEPSLARLAGGNLSVEFATRRGRDAADDRIVEIVEERPVELTPPELTVVTSDRGLIDRLAPGVVTVGAGRFRRLLAPPRGQGHGRDRQRRR